MADGLKIFVSYAHEDERFKERLLTVLAGLRRRGLIQVWEDHQIGVGTRWESAIGQAMATCNMAILLVTDAFLASEFIRSQELTTLMGRQRTGEVRVVPIIIRPCLWQHESFAALQCLPANGRAIATFPEENGERDQIWTDIAGQIAQWAEAGRNFPGTVATNERPARTPAVETRESTDENDSRSPSFASRPMGANSPASGHSFAPASGWQGNTAAVTFQEMEWHIRRGSARRYQMELLAPRTGRRDANNGVISWQDVDTMSDLGVKLPAHGVALGATLFRSNNPLNEPLQSRLTEATPHRPLRLLLVLGESVPELLTLFWESLVLPGESHPITREGRVLVTRLLDRSEWPTAPLRPQGPLVVRYLSDAGSLTAAMTGIVQGMANLQCTPLELTDSPDAEGILEMLSAGCDLLFLSLDMSGSDENAQIQLMHPTGNATPPFSETRLANALGRINPPLRLLVLTPIPAPDGQMDPEKMQRLCGLAPILMAQGVQSVVVTPSPVAPARIADLWSFFLREIVADGRIDRASVAAWNDCCATSGQEPVTVPAVFTRIRSGRLWFVPGFREQGPGFDKWPALLSSIEYETCTPILGPALANYCLPSRREIARSWAKSFGFPKTGKEREDLAQVAQYMAVNQGWIFPRNAFAKMIYRELDALSRPETPTSPADARLRQEQEKGQPYRILANLPFPIYVTTDPTHLLRDALTQAGKFPRVELCRWNRDLLQLPSIYDETPRYRPDPQHPLIYQLFGNIGEPRSLVLTEDDYFSFLIGITRNRESVPRAIRAVLADSTLLFLGFSMEDWSFRVLFHSIMGQEGSERLRDYAHIAVQVDPEDGPMPDPEKARHYLETYFQNSRISIYWGNAETFTRDIQYRWREP